MRIVLIVAGLVAGLAPAAAQTVRHVGGWTVSESRDRFGDETRHVALTKGAVGTLAVRCIGKRFSIVLGDADREPMRPGDAFEIRLRVDAGEIVTTRGEAIDSRLVQIDAAPTLVAELRKGREIAVRVRSERASYDRLFRLRDAGRALAGIAAACPG